MKITVHPNKKTAIRQDLGQFVNLRIIEEKKGNIWELIIPKNEEQGLKEFLKHYEGVVLMR